jgi:hypothetical protein
MGRRKSLSREFNEECIIEDSKYYEDEDNCDCEFSRFSPLGEDIKPVKIVTKKGKPKQYYRIINYNLCIYPDPAKRPKVKPPSTSRGNKTFLGYKTPCPYCNNEEFVLFWGIIAYCSNCCLQWNVKLS